MAVHHIKSSIEGLLKQEDKFLGKLFNMPGLVARIELEKLREQGDLYIPSDKCKHFDPKIGCLCSQKDNN
jgi:hypothetical protein